MVKEVEFRDESDNLKVAELVGSPLNLSETEVRTPDAPPRIGQHTDEILRETLAVKDDELMSLRHNNVIK
jgi:crotonobetainyl-CoA:carnitine CoA-transferase CaiB-like acyl-CoA transferase